MSDAYSDSLIGYLQQGTSIVTLDGLRALVECQNMDVNRKDEHGVTPLLEAIDSFPIEFAQYLLEHGADVNATNADGWPLACSPVMDGNPDKLRLLLDYGAELEAMIPESEWTLFPYANRGCFEFDLRMRSDNGNNWRHLSQPCGIPPLFLAAFYGSYDVWRILIEHGADIHRRVQNGKTLLHYAAEALNQGKHILFSLVTEHHFDVDSVDDFGNTPFMQAAAAGNLSSMNFLLDHGANPWLKNKENKSGVGIAVRYGNWECLDFLLRYPRIAETGEFPGMRDNYRVSDEEKILYNIRRKEAIRQFRRHKYGRRKKR